MPLNSRSASAITCVPIAFGILMLASQAVHAETKTECTLNRICYCVNSEMKDAITSQVDKIRGMIDQQKKQGKAVGYMSVPLSTIGGSFFNVNAKIAAETKERVERRFGSASAWLLDPGAREMSLPDGATGRDYMLMWTQVLEGKSGLGDDFDFVYFVGPSDFAKHFGLDGNSDMSKIEVYFDERLKTDSSLQKAVNDKRLDRNSFRNYYALRASTTFSLGAHDEWNIVQTINQQRRKSADFGIARQLPVLFDGSAPALGSSETSIASGYTGECK